MDEAWKVEHQTRVAAMPADVREAHRHSSQNREELRSSSKCGCFYCGSIFEPGAVTDWVDEDASGTGQTALCPRCGIDSVIGDASGFEISSIFMARLKSYWF